MPRPTLIRRLLLIPAGTLFALLLMAPPAWADWVWPLRGEVITPYRNGADPYAAGQHRGIDIAGEPGAAVVAAVGGEVRFSGTAGSSGLTVSIRTHDGRFDTSYLHLSAAAVVEGQRVAGGDRIGAVGTSGVRSAERPHLHFGVRDADTSHAYHDPLTFLPPMPAAPERPGQPIAPRAAPVPVALPPTPAPLRVPAGRRVPAPRAAPEPRRVPSDRRVPAGRRIPAGRRVPATGPERSPAPAPARRPAPVPRGAPTPRPAPAGHRAPGDHRSTLPSPAARRLHAGAHVSAAQGAAPNTASRPEPTTAAARTRQQQLAPPQEDGPRGLDLGWALACLGLILAAALLGLSEDGRKTTRRSRDRLAGLLWPLLGRR
ncbi:MAG: lipoprotein NlpD [Thermoleophilaceae bacterium]|nr:lipoprotein NlpD [Thermoleophilaceae bacterium]